MLIKTNVFSFTFPNFLLFFLSRTSYLPLYWREHKLTTYPLKPNHREKQTVSKISYSLRPWSSSNVDLSSVIQDVNFSAGGTLVTLPVQKDGGKLSKTKMRIVERNWFSWVRTRLVHETVAISLTVVWKTWYRTSRQRNIYSVCLSLLLLLLFSIILNKNNYTTILWFFKRLIAKFDIK